MERKVDMKVHYDKDEDILMLILSNKKIDDSYETESGIVEVAKDGEPVILTILKASTMLKNLGKAIPKSVQKEVWSNSPSIAHRIK